MLALSMSSRLMSSPRLCFTALLGSFTQSTANSSAPTRPGHGPMAVTDGDAVVAEGADDMHGGGGKGLLIVAAGCGIRAAPAAATARALARDPLTTDEQLVEALRGLAILIAWRSVFYGLIRRI